MNNSVARLPLFYLAAAYLTAVKSTRPLWRCWQLMRSVPNTSVLPPIPGRPKTVDHFTGQATALAGDDDNRNVLAESARIARGSIKDLSEFNPAEFDAIVFPGGFGAATNWSNFALKGAECEVNSEVEKAVQAAYRGGLVIGAMCIAPVVIARILGKHHVK